MSASRTFNVPHKFRRGAKKANVDQMLDSSLWLLNYMANIIGHKDLYAVDVLDMGCGTKFTQAILDNDVAIRRYVGVDVYAEMIQFLQDKVTDPRFEYRHLDIHNEMYNLGGSPLQEYRELGVETGSFDIICLFSVFTHLAPHDYPAMLKLLRPYIRPQGKLIFSLFVNEITENGAGLITRFSNLSGGSEEDKPATQADIPDFIDLDKDKPLKFAVYSRDYAIKLIENTGWKVERLELPVDNLIQHHFICIPDQAKNTI